MQVGCGAYPFVCIWRSGSIRQLLNLLMSCSCVGTRPHAQEQPEIQRCHTVVFEELLKSLGNMLLRGHVWCLEFFEAMTFLEK